MGHAARDAGEGTRMSRSPPAVTRTGTTQASAVAGLGKTHVGRTVGWRPAPAALELTVAPCSAPATAVENAVAPDRPVDRDRATTPRAENIRHDDGLPAGSAAVNAARSRPCSTTAHTAPTSSARTIQRAPPRLLRRRARPAARTLEAALCRRMRARVTPPLLVGATFAAAQRLFCLTACQRLP